jgi:hypothetical protein
MLSVSNARSTCSSSSSSITYTQNNLRVWVSCYCVCVCVCVCERERERERERWLCRCGFPYRATTTQNRHSCFPKAKSCTVIFFALGTLTSFGHTTLGVCAVVSVRGLFFPPSMTGILQCCTGISEQSGSWVLQACHQYNYSGSRVRMELGMNMTFTLGFWVSFFQAWWILQWSIIQHYDDLLGRCLLF